MSLHKFAEQVAAQGRGDDSLLVHMTPEEVRNLQKFAEANGTTLTINPTTGLPEAGLLSDLFKAVAPIALGAFLGPGAFGIAGLNMSAGMAGAAVGGLTTLATGSLSRGLMAGLGAYGGAGMAEGLASAGTNAMTTAGVGDYASSLAERGIYPTLEGGALNPAFGEEASKIALESQKQALAAPMTDRVSAGFTAATANPSAMGSFAKDNFKYLGAAAAPIMADMMTPTTTKMPDLGNTGYIRQKSYDPYTQTYRSMAPVKASEWGDRQFSEVPRGFNGGGIVALAGGGVSDQQVKDWFLANQGASDADIAKAMQEFKVGTAQIARATGTMDQLGDYNTRFVQQVAQPDTTATQFLAATSGAGIQDQGLASALQNSGLSAAAQYAATHSDVGTGGGLAGLSQNINTALATPNLTLQQAQTEMNKYGLTDADVLRATGQSTTDIFAARDAAAKAAADQAAANSKAAADKAAADQAARDRAAADAIAAAKAADDKAAADRAAAAKAALDAKYKQVADEDAAALIRTNAAKAAADKAAADAAAKLAADKAAADAAAASKVISIGTQDLGTSTAVKQDKTDTTTVGPNTYATTTPGAIKSNITVDGQYIGTSGETAPIGTKVGQGTIAGVGTEANTGTTGPIIDFGGASAFTVSPLKLAQQQIAEQSAATNAAQNTQLNLYRNWVTQNPTATDLEHANFLDKIELSPDIAAKATPLSSQQMKNRYYDAKYNKMTGDSQAAYNFLMGKGAYPTKSGVGEIMRPYSEATLGMPASTNKKYLFDPATKSYKLNRDFVGSYRDSTGAVNYTMTPNEIAAYFKSNQGQADSATYDWAIQNNLSPEEIAAATGVPLSTVAAKWRDAKAKKDSVAKAAADKAAAAGTAKTALDSSSTGGNANGGLMRLANGGITGDGNLNLHIPLDFCGGGGGGGYSGGYSAVSSGGGVGSIGVTGSTGGFSGQNNTSSGGFGALTSGSNTSMGTTAPSSNSLFGMGEDVYGAGAQAANAATQNQNEINWANSRANPASVSDLAKRLNLANGGITGYAVGGGLGSLGSYSDGGRLLKGPGDGVSDSIPATIGAKQQPARLADGEFVIPARIVSELGNGSTEAGAKKLYAMMDRVQRARGKTTGKNKVAANSRADKYLPA